MVIVIQAFLYRPAAIRMNVSILLELDTGDMLHKLLGIKSYISLICQDCFRYGQKMSLFPFSNLFAD